MAFSKEEIERIMTQTRRAARAKRFRKTWDGSMLFPFKAELIELSRNGASSRMLREYLLMEHDLAVHHTSVWRFLQGVKNDIQK